MEYYIWQADETGRHFRDLLIERAKDGVECRLLVDSFGSFHLNRRFLAPLRQAGVKFEFFGRLARFRPVWLGHLRNHRKIVVVDGQTSYIGSQNIGDEYRGRHERLKPWFDCQLRIHGPATLLLQHTFAEDWYVATGEALGADGYFPIPVRDGASLVQILPTGPDQDVMLMEQLLFTAISTAQKSINIATAYFIPSSVVRMALVYAKMRGVKVRLVVPSLTDSVLALWAGRSFYDELVEAGVRVCELGRGMMHSKIITIDDRWGMVGSVNMDIRSFRLNFEVTALIYEEGVARELAAIIDGFCAEATDITLEHCRRRPINEQLKMGLARLLSPLL